MVFILLVLNKDELEIGKLKKIKPLRYPMYNRVFLHGA